MAIRHLGEICAITMGQAPDGESYNDKGLGLPLIAGAGDFGQDFPIAKKFTSAPTKTCEPGDIIMSIRATIGTKVLSDGVYCIGRGVAGLRPTGDIHDRYLWHWLDTAKHDLAARGRGATFPQVSRADIEGLAIRLPPLEEQRRIAAILDKADALRRKRKHAIELLREASQSAFLEVCGDSLRRPPDTTLEEFAEIQIGFPFKSSEFSEKPDDVRLCRGTNVLPNEINWEDLARWPKERSNEFIEFLLREGDILVAMDRPWISSGFKVARISSADTPALLVQRVARIRPKSEIDGNFLFALVQNPIFSGHFRPTETTVPHISPTEIKKFSFARPDASTRERFSGCITNLRKTLLALNSQSVSYESLFSSLQSRAFSGQL